MRKPPPVSKSAVLSAGAVDFFFQAEDGIRDVAVTGVQTCALPICSRFIGPSLAKRERRGAAVRVVPPSPDASALAPCSGRRHVLARRAADRRALTKRRDRKSVV